MLSNTEKVINVDSTSTPNEKIPGLDAPALLADLKKLLKRVEEDLRKREQEDAGTAAALKGKYAEQTKKNRTALKYAEWREDQLTQVAEAWVLAGVFLRYVEDNGWVEHPWLAAEPTDAGRRAWVESRYEAYFKEHRTASDRDYLLHVATQAASLPGLQDLFAEHKNPIWSPVTISGDMGMELRRFWNEADPDTNRLRRSLVDPSGDTRFLGDLYQDLSESARKKFALLQTPGFIADFLLDRTLEPAIATFGLERVRMIDPACGSGHLLLGAFERLFQHWLDREPGGNHRELAMRALGAVHGVDINPAAVAIARFRLVTAVLKACEIGRLADAPDLDAHLHLAVGDSLLGGKKFDRLGRGAEQTLLATDEGSLAPDPYATETPRELNAILGQQYHTVVGNPPYITPKDRAMNQAYRDRYETCHRLYSLGIPFTERFFELALTASDNSGLAGYVGMITANSFMKREFGKKLTQDFFPQVDLTHVIDTSKAYIPGHGTPTVMLLGRNRKPFGTSVRAVLGIKGETTSPEDPSQGLVWRSIVSHIDRAGAGDEYISTVDAPRATFACHPWSIAGGGAIGLREDIESECSATLGDYAITIGFMCITKQDDVFPQEKPILLRQRCEMPNLRSFGIGENTRDWSQAEGEWVIFPYDNQVKTIHQNKIENIIRFMWPHKAILWSRKLFGGLTYKDAGKPWYEYGQIPADRQSTPLSLAFTFFSTHNHCILDRGGKVFKHSIQLVKLPGEATEREHIELLGILNSSTSCYWLKQTCHDKGGGGIGGGLATESWEHFFDFTATNLQRLPIPEEKPHSLAEQLDALGRRLIGLLPDATIQAGEVSAQRLTNIHSEATAIQRRMIALQEELDWQCYCYYGLLPSEGSYDHEGIPEITLGQRAFEIVLARRVAAGEEQTAWFARHGSTPITELPADWPDWYRTTVERRIELIGSDPNIGLIERPEYKRRWSREPWDDQVRRALRGWLLDRLESPAYWPCHHGAGAGPDAASPGEPALTTTARLADLASADAEFLRVAALYRGQEAVDVPRLVAELVASESVPLLPALRYTPTGLRKRQDWRETWELQKAEDRGRRSDETDGPIPVPPKYTNKDFQKADSWRLRGKLDVPKERFVSFPHCERPGDPSLVVAWAGWDHLQLAQAIASYYVHVQGEGVGPGVLVPLLAGLDELLFWLDLWHNDLDPSMGMGLGDYYADFVQTEAMALGYTVEQVRAWQPPEPVKKARGGRKKKGED